MLGTITDNIEGKLDKHCVMRWTVSAVCFRKIMENYQALLQSMRDRLKKTVGVFVLLFWVESGLEFLCSY